MTQVTGRMLLLQNWSERQKPKVVTFIATFTPGEEANRGSEGEAMYTNWAMTHVPPSPATSDMNEEKYCI